jgi:hypothetical protein
VALRLGDVRRDQHPWLSAAGRASLAARCPELGAGRAMLDAHPEVHKAAQAYYFLRGLKSRSIDVILPTMLHGENGTIRP